MLPYAHCKARGSYLNYTFGANEDPRSDYTTDDDRDSTDKADLRFKCDDAGVFFTG